MITIFKNYIKENKYNDKDNLTNKLYDIDEKHTGGYGEYKLTEECKKLIKPLIDLDFDYEIIFDVNDYMENDTISIIADSDTLCAYLDIYVGDLITFIEYNRSYLSIEEEEDEEALNHRISVDNLKILKSIYGKFNIKDNVDALDFFNSRFFSRIKDMLLSDISYCDSNSKQNHAFKIDEKLPFEIMFSDSNIVLKIPLEELENFKTVNSFIDTNKDKLDDIESMDYSYDLDDDEIKKMDESHKYNLLELLKSVDDEWDLESFFYENDLIETSEDLDMDSERIFAKKIGGAFKLYLTDEKFQKKYIGDDLDRYNTMIENGSIIPSVMNDLLYLQKTDDYDI